jgi:UDP-N-acetylenolpyruvoylglucosamine reductase
MDMRTIVRNVAFAVLLGTVSSITSSALEVSLAGTIGGAIIGNAGQGFGGRWIDSYVRSVTVFMDGRWQILSPIACRFRYRESAFKEVPGPVVVWEVTLEVPSREAPAVKKEIDELLQRRIDTQPHQKNRRLGLQVAARRHPGLETH